MMELLIVHQEGVAIERRAGALWRDGRDRGGINKFTEC